MSDGASAALRLYRREFVRRARRMGFPISSPEQVRLWVNIALHRPADCKTPPDEEGWRNAIAALSLLNPEGTYPQHHGKMPHDVFQEVLQDCWHRAHGEKPMPGSRETLYKDLFARTNAPQERGERA